MYTFGALQVVITEDQKLARTKNFRFNLCTVCPGSSDPFYIVTYYIKWVTTSWPHSTLGDTKAKITICELSL